MKSIHFDFFGHGLVVSATPEHAAALEDLREDFSYFAVQPEVISAENQIVLSGSAGPEPRGPALFTTNMCRAYGLGSTRVCDYGDGTISRLTDHGEGLLVEIFGRDREHVFEVAFSALLSIIGERLDRSGFHRVHALGFRMGGAGVLLPLPQGGGKSATGLLVLENAQAQIYSDETPLLKGGCMYPFPVRFALRPEVAQGLGLTGAARVFKRKVFPAKSLFPVAHGRVAEAAPVDVLLSGVTGARAPRIEACSKAAAFECLLKYMVVGIGVAQMREHMLRVAAAPALAMIAASRLREAWTVTRAARTAVFHVGPDARENTRLLLAYLKEAQ